MFNSWLWVAQIAKSKFVIPSSCKKFSSVASALKTFAEPLLLQVDKSSEYFSESRRLYHFIQKFLPIETKDIPNDEAKRTVEDAKINNAERFFQQLKIDGYEVKFCRQLQNKKMANIISELLEEDASNPV